jgi:Big-like domain-containing protein/K319-like protein
MVRARPWSIVHSCLCIAWIAACGGNSGSGPPPHQEPAPTIATTSPADKATDVPLSSNVTVTFSQPMAADSLASMGLKLTPAVSGTVTPNGATATFSPASPLSPAMKYDVMVPAGVKDTKGQALAADYHFSFTTVDVPTVVSTDPAQNAADVPVEAVIKATFSKDMAPDSVSTASFTIAPQVSGTVRYSARTATFTPQSSLAFTAAYTATITTDAKDTAGNAMPASYSWTFQTKAPPDAPVAKAGPDQEVNRAGTVTLDGSASSAVSGKPLTYSWTQVVGTDVTGGKGKLSGVHPAFPAPAEVDTLQFDLVVNDSIHNSLPSRVTIHVMKSAGKGVFVSKAGADTAAGSRSDPLLTIQKAITKAAPNQADVYVSAGTYAEAIVLANGVSIFGGFDASKGWLRSVSNQVIVAAPSAVAVSAAAVTVPLELQMVSIRSAAATVPGASSIGVSVSSSSARIALRDSSVAAGAGAPAAVAFNGVAGAKGGDGGKGATPARGVGGFSSCAGGGNGGIGVKGSSNGNPGASGTMAFGGAAGGSGGSAATGFGQCRIALTHGNPAPDNAVAGSNGASGNNGVASGALGSFSATAYVPPSSGAGTSGSHGGGGGGGGSGSGDSSVCNVFDCCDATSGGGGGGGGAGCAGGGGGGGLGGGGSFAVVSLNSNLSIENTKLSAAAGGAGGVGGAGGFGGTAGVGGANGLSNGQSAGNGAPGKAGGSGGGGGAGAGGAGGPSICVAHVSTAPVMTGMACTKAAGGTGGAGGLGAHGQASAGPAGFSADVRQF